MIFPVKASRVAAVLLVVVPLLVGLFLPSQRLMPDGLDELIVIQSPRLEINPKHPAAEAGLWLGFRAMRACGYVGQPIRPVQLWNAFWLTAALAGLLVATRAWLSKERLAAFACLPFLSVSLHWATDPFLAYWPPALAALGWALVLARGPLAPPRLLGLLILLVLMVFINPIFCLALPAVAFLAKGRVGEEPKAFLPRLLMLLVVPPLVLFLYLSGLGEGRPPAANIFGVFSAHKLPQGFEALQDAFFTSRDELARLYPGFGALLKKACNLMLLVAAGMALASLLKGEERRRGWALVLALPALLGILWWAPQQRFFYLLPIWLLFALWPPAAAGEAAARPPAAKSSRASFLLFVPATALALVNGVSYLAPVQAEDPRRAWITACGQKFQATDRLYLPHFGDATFTYFGGLETTSLLEHFRNRRPGQSTFDSLKEALETRRQAGGAIYFQVPRKNQQWVPLRIRERVELDYDDASLLARFEWGEEVECGPAKFRRLVAIR